MILRLVRHHLVSYPELGNVLKEEIPLGTEYEIIDFCPGAKFMNINTGVEITIDTYLVVRDGTMRGLLPVEVFGD